MKSGGGSSEGSLGRAAEKRVVARGTLKNKGCDFNGRKSNICMPMGMTQGTGRRT